MSRADENSSLRRFCITGLPAEGPSKYYPDIRRPRHLEPWKFIANSVQLTLVATSAAIGYSFTGSEEIRRLFDRAVFLMNPERHVREGMLLPSGDAAGLLSGLVAVACRSGDDSYLRTAGLLARHLVERNRHNGFFTSGLEDGERYYASRAGCGDLAAALLSYVLAAYGRQDMVPPIRNQEGRMSW